MRGGMVTALRDLQGENALVIVGTVGRLLRQLDRECGTTHEQDYKRRAMSGNYEHLCTVTEEYAVQWLQTTLHASEGDLTDRDEDDDWEED